MKNNKIEYDNTRNEIVAELGSALNEEAEGADNHNLILKLQSSLNSIDIDLCLSISYILGRMDKPVWCGD